MEILLNVPKNKVWDLLPPDCRTSIAEKAVEALLQGEVYPSGAEQLELAILLAERSVDPQVISQITRLESALFSDFLTTK